MLPLVHHSTFCQSSSHFFLDALSFSVLQQEKRKREIKSGKILCSFDLNRKHYRFVLPFFSSLTTMMTANIMFQKRLEYFTLFNLSQRHSSPLQLFFIQRSSMEGKLKLKISCQHGNGTLYCA